MTTASVPTERLPVVRVRVVKDGQQGWSEEPIAWQEAGLAVHRDPHLPGWNVTHVQSGYSVKSNIRTRRTAIRLGQLLLWLGDWTRSRTKLTDDKEFLAAAREVINREA